MCRLDTKTYRNNDGTERIVDIIYRCSDAPEQGFCDPMLEDRVRTSESVRSVRSSPERPSSDGVMTTESYGGRQRTYRIVQSQSVRSGRTGRQRDSPRSTTSAPARFPAPPRAPTPPATGVEFPYSRTPPSPRYSPRYTEERHPVVAGYGRPPSPTIVEIRPEQHSPMSSTFADITPHERQSPEPRPPRRVNTSRLPSSPALSSPGLSQLPRVSGSKHDSARESPVPDDDVKYRSRQPSSPDFRERQRQEDERQARIEQRRLERNAPPPSPTADYTVDFHRQRARDAVNDEYERMAEADRRQMDREKNDDAARKRRSTGEVQSSVSRYNPRTGLQTSSRPKPVVHQRHPPSSSKNALQSKGTNVIAREQDRMESRDDSPVQRATRQLEDVMLSDEGPSSSKEHKRRYDRRERDDDSEEGGRRRWL